MFRAIAIASLMTASAAAAPLAGPPRTVPEPIGGIVEAKTKKPIDKSCLMICKRWGEDDCLEWKMVCKGDADYPKGVMLDRLN